MSTVIALVRRRAAPSAKPVRAAAAAITVTASRPVSPSSLARRMRRAAAHIPASVPGALHALVRGRGAGADAGDAASGAATATATATVTGGGGFGGSAPAGAQTQMFRIRTRLQRLAPRARVRVALPPSGAAAAATRAVQATEHAAAAAATATASGTGVRLMHGGAGRSALPPSVVARPLPTASVAAAAVSSAISGRSLGTRARAPLAVSTPAVRAMSTASSSSSGGQRNGGRQHRQSASGSAHVPLWRQLLLGGASALALAAVAHDLYNWQSAKACGIVGFIGSEPAVPYLMEGLSILQNRGYDSAGVATLHRTEKGYEVNTSKFASLGTSDSVAKLKSVAPTNHGADTIGISHTRWATHGGKTDENAHPHSDHKDRLALVHNGTIENSAALKSELEARGIPFRSQTDTEVIVQLIGTYLDEKIPLVDAVKKALGRLEGTWGICLISREHPDQIIAARNGSPLVIGIGENRMFVASETSAFARHTNQYISLSDGEVAVIKANGTDLDLSRVEKAHVEEIALDPAPYPNWTIKEIMEQPEAIARTLNYGGRFTADGVVKLGGLQANADMLLSVRNLSIAACGTSLFAGMYGARLMRWLNCFDTVYTVDAAEVVPEYLPAQHGGLLVISQSGETKDTHRALIHAESQFMPRFSIVNQVGSLIARSTKCGVYLNAGREHAVASTKAFTTQVAALALVAGWYAQNRHSDAAASLQSLLAGGGVGMGGAVSVNGTPVVGAGAPKASTKGAPGAVPTVDGKALVPVAGSAPVPAGGKLAHTPVGRAVSDSGSISQRRADLIESIHRLPTYTGMTLKTHDKCKSVAEKLKDKQHIFVLGKGFAEPIAYEGALKIKEIGYCHAEGYSGGALKHGPFALLEEGTPVILLILDDQHGELMRIAAQETKARGAYNIVITDSPKLAQGVAHDTITIPSNGPLTALLGVIPLQMIAYEMAMAKGVTVDTPRNLAKAVTVD